MCLIHKQIKFQTIKLSAIVTETKLKDWLKWIRVIYVTLVRLGVRIRVIGKLIISALIDLNISFCLATCKKVGKPIRQSYRYKKSGSKPLLGFI